MSRRAPITKQMVERWMGKPIPQEAWKYVVDHFYVEEAEGGKTGGKKPLEHVASAIREVLNAGGSRSEEPAARFVPSRRRQRRQAVLPLRLEVISELVAAIARR